MPSALKKIIISCLKIVFLSFGGGVAVIPLIHEEFINKNQLISEEDFNKAVVLANIFPGPTILQLTAYICYKSCSYLGVFIAFIIIFFTGPILLILLLTILKYYLPQDILFKFAQGLIPAIVALLFDFSVKMLKKDKEKKQNWLIYTLILGVTTLLLVLKINVIIVFFIVIVFIVSLIKLGRKYV